MSERLYELKARINADGSTALEVRDLFTLANGREVEGDPRPVQASDADVVAFIAAFNANSVADAQEKAATIAQQTTLIQQLYSERDQLSAQVIALEAEIAALRNPTNSPAILTPREFMGRFTADELDGIQLAGVQATGVVQLASFRAQRLLFSQLEVHIDHTDTVEGVHGLAAVGLIEPDRIAAILAPRGEA